MDLQMIAPFLMIPGVLLIFGFFWWLESHLSKRRTETMRGVSDQLGLVFSDTLSERLRARIDGFSVMNRGRKRKVRNVMVAETEAAKDDNL